MTVAVRGTHTTDVGTGTASVLTVDLSTASAVAGDIAIIVAEFSVNGGSLSLNRTGYTDGGLINLSTTFTGQSWAKVLTSTDISDDTIDITCSGSGRASAGLIVLSGSSGFDSVSPNPATDSHATNDTSQPIAGIDPVAASAVYTVLGVNCAAGGTNLADSVSGWSREFNEFTAHGSGRRAGVAAFSFDTNPTTSSVSATSATSDTNAHAASWTWALVEDSGSTDAEVLAVAATGTGTAPAPSLSAGSSVTAVAATATGLANAPTVSAGASVAAVAATGTATALAPTLSASATVAPPAATATGLALPPTVTGDGTDAEVLAVTATGTATALAPTVSGSSTVTAVTATGTATALAPGVSAASQIDAVTATATGAALAPTVTGGGGGATVTAVTATGTAEALAPTVSADAQVAAVCATAQGTAHAPTVDGIHRFIPPTYEVGMNTSVRPLNFYRTTRGLSIVRINGTLTAVRTPSSKQLTDAGEEGVDYFMGGHEYEVGSTAAQELVAAGFPMS